MRNIDENYLSLHSRGWRIDLDGYIGRLESALEALLEFQAWSLRHEEEWKINVLHLNDFLSSEHQARWLSGRLFAHIVVDTPERKINRFIASSQSSSARST